MEWGLGSLGGETGTSSWRWEVLRATDSLLFHLGSCVKASGTSVPGDDASPASAFAPSQRWQEKPTSALHTFPADLGASWPLETSGSIATTKPHCFLL